MIFVYVAGPYTAPTHHEITQNINNAWALGIEVAKLGAFPVVPHTCNAHMEDLQGQDFWIEGTKKIMRTCDAVLIVPNYENSKGTLGEISEAKRLGMPVFYRVEDLEKWSMEASDDTEHSA